MGSSHTLNNSRQYNLTNETRPVEAETQQDVILRSKKLPPKSTSVNKGLQSVRLNRCKKAGNNSPPAETGEQRQPSVTLSFLNALTIKSFFLQNISVRMEGERSF